MKITVECASKIKHQDIISILEKNESPKYQYVGGDKFNFTKLNFEADYEGSEDDLVARTKMLLKKAPEMDCISFRVIPTGNEMFMMTRKKK